MVCGTNQPSGMLQLLNTYNREGRKQKKRTYREFH